MVKRQTDDSITIYKKLNEEVCACACVQVKQKFVRAMKIDDAIGLRVAHNRSTLLAS